jgi:hypothetical protein
MYLRPRISPRKSVGLHPAIKQVINIYHCNEFFDTYLCIVKIKIELYLVNSQNGTLLQVRHLCWTGPGVSTVPTPRIRPDPSSAYNLFVTTEANYGSRVHALHFILSFTRHRFSAAAGPNLLIGNTNTSIQIEFAYTCMLNL